MDISPQLRLERKEHYEKADIHTTKYIEPLP